MDAVETEMLTLEGHINAAIARKLELVGWVDRTEGWAKRGAKSCAHWLSWWLRLQPGAAREQVRVARKLAALPKMREELQHARVTYSQARAMTRVATPENEGRLIELAHHATAAQLERIVRGVRQVEAADAPALPPERWVRQRVMDDGTVRVEAQLDADEATLVMEAIRTTRAAMAAERVSAESPADHEGVSAEASAARSVSAETEDPRVPSFADALVRMAEEVEARRQDGDASPATRTGGERTTLVVHLGPDALGDDFAAQLDDGTRVSAETFRRLACDCSLVAVHEDEHGDPLDVGRKTRSISPAVRRAVMLRDGGCAFPSCTHDRFVDCHHIVHWAHGGETKKDNLMCLCTFHHRLVHEGGWSVTRDEERGPRFADPDGRELPRLAGLEPSAPGETLRAQLLSAQADLGICEESMIPKWDGRTPDYRMCVEAVGRYAAREREESEDTILN